MTERNPLPPGMTGRDWPLTMTQAAHIARIPRDAGSDEMVAAEYRVPVSLIRQIRSGGGYNGVNLPVSQ